MGKQPFVAFRKEVNRELRRALTSEDVTLDDLCDIVVGIARKCGVEVYDVLDEWEVGDTYWTYGRGFVFRRGRHCYEVELIVEGCGDVIERAKLTSFHRRAI